MVVTNGSVVVMNVMMVVVNCAYVVVGQVGGSYDDGGEDTVGGRESLNGQTRMRCMH